MRTSTAIAAATLLSWLGFAAVAPARAQTPGIRAKLVVSGLTAPLFVTAPAGDPRLFVVERAGRIRIVQNGAITGTFLDITSKVSTAGESGLLGLAFPPDHATSRFFYVYYIELDGDSVLARYQVSANPNVANTAETQILNVDQPSTTNHKGGTIAFGADGFLYWGLGDGGGSNDPAERAQDGTQLLGKMLRLDVGVPPAPDSLPVAGANYAIPAGNPFAAPGGTRDEIWSLGLRNPYRWSFDRTTGDMWIADVGQGAREEVDFEPFDDTGGRNWGWDVMEGTLCNLTDPAPSPPCNAPSLSLPVHQYPHSGGNCSITGGYVYRGIYVPVATGLYFFGDYCTGNIWSLDPDTLAVTPRTSELSPAAGATNRLVGFGEDGGGELLIVHSTGSIFQLALRTACSNALDDDGDGLTDFPADPGCAGEESLAENPACNDGSDNDGDGFIDLADPGCGGDPARNREGPSGACGLGFELALVLPGLARLRRRRS
jgi:glucose/arabinose dehydrogenase